MKTIPELCVKEAEASEETTGEITEDIVVSTFKDLKISLADFYKKNKEWIIKEEQEEYENK